MQTVYLYGHFPNMSQESWLAYLQNTTIPGISAGELIEAHQQAVPTSIRMHPLKGAGLVEEMKQVAWCKDGVYLPQRPDFTLDPYFHAGAYYVQEASSMSIQAALDELGADFHAPKVLDLCAAPGGKSTLIASWLNGRGILVANETIRSRASILNDQLSKWGYSNTVVTNNDPERFGSLPGFFDILLVDAPCSGSGLFRKDPQAMNQWSASAVLHCAARQERIIEDVWPSLKEDGVLLYSTCSFSVEENEEIALKIIEMGAETVPLQRLEKLNIHIYSSGPGYRFYPGHVEGEGFYLCAFRKTKKEKQVAVNSGKTIVQKNTAITERLADWIRLNEKHLTIETHLGQVVFPASNIGDAALLLKNFKVLRLGLIPGQMAGKDFIPDQDLAFSLHLSEQVASVELDLNQALCFLKKESTSLPNPGKGWFVVRYNGLGLGWIKAMPGRINNYLPKHLRILKAVNSNGLSVNSPK
jgi:16S rRNA C967 or C1407 C5-methylase (RsmB/RsmF family)/NOL1/NOP2/fmu family ribosome biogenesis protein